MGRQVIVAIFWFNVKYISGARKGKLTYVLKYNMPNLR